MEIRFFNFLSEGTDQELADCLGRLAPETGSTYKLCEGWFREGKGHTVVVSSVEDGHVVLFSKRSQRFYRISLGDWWEQSRYKNILFIQGPEFNPRPRYRKTYPAIKRLVT